MALNGLNIAYLDGVDKSTPELSFTKDTLLGLTKDVHENIDAVVNGYDLIGFRGDDSIEDDEHLRNYLLRTKQVVEAYPASVENVYKNPQTFSKMLGAVLGAWDTDKREDTIDRMAAIESQMIDNGSINIGFSDDAEDIAYFDGDEDYDNEYYHEVRIAGIGASVKTVAVKHNKKGLFNRLKKMIEKKDLTTPENNIVSKNPFFKQQITNSRRNVAVARSAAKPRKVVVKDSITNENKTVKLLPIAKQSNLAGFESNNDIQAILNGTDFSTNINGKTAVRNHLIRNYKVLAANPEEYFEDEEEENEVLGSLEYAIANINGEFDKVLCNLAGVGMNDEDYDAFLGYLGKSKAERKAEKKEIKKRKQDAKAAKKAATTKAEKKAARKQYWSAVKDNQKRIAKNVKTAAKKAGKAIVKAVKKVTKVLIKYNPVTLIARGVILMACNINMFKMAERMYYGTIAKEEAAKEGVSTEAWETGKKAYEKLAKGFKKIGGNESKLKKALAKGHKRAWNGSDSFNAKELLNRALKNKENIDKSVSQDEAALKEQGATVSNDPNVTYEETKQEVEIDATDTAVGSILGLFDNNYLTIGSLGVVTEAAVASGCATAGGVLSAILSTLKSSFKNIDLKKIKQNAKETIKEKVQQNFSAMNQPSVDETQVNETSQTIDEQNVATKNKDQQSSNIKTVAIIGVGVLAFGAIAAVIISNKNNAREQSKNI